MESRQEEGEKATSVQHPPPTQSFVLWVSIICGLLGADLLWCVLTHMQIS